MKTITRIAIALIALAAIAGYAPAAHAQNGYIIPVTSYTISPLKTRYHRGEVFNVNVHVENTFFYWQNGQLHRRNLGPAERVVVRLTEHSSMGSFLMWAGRTDHSGNCTIPYQVPLNPNKDRVSICPWNENDEPFEGQEFKVPIGT